ncbi:MAG: dTDP-4-dehydrorhamnose reductase [Carnobacterium sp.]|uniref:dTDP-4-dehydrorhamnose reductase n=1 Tax=Carnobacterium sp. TaxID=48221 RepID=UPI003C7159CD
MTVLITGGNGQLGSELRKLLDEKKVNYISTDSKELDITDGNAVKSFIESLNPDTIYHCAAYTAVDKAEDEGKETNYLVNVEGTRNIAKAAEQVGATLVYISTDYVFDGSKQAEYTIDDETNPKNEYGHGKLEGEKIVRDLVTNYYIVRTSWVFGEFGSNFVYTMQRLAETHDKLTVVSDQFGRPTWTRTLAEFITFIVEENVEYGTYHLSNDGSCSWYEFANEILKNKKVEVAPVTSNDYPQKAYRPKHSIMDLSKSKELGFIIPTWEDALKTFLSKLE